MGLADLFNPLGNDFTPSVESDYPVFLDSIGQNTRITIDEDGVTGVAYTLFVTKDGEAPGSPDEVDFVVDRPFLFLITGADDVPLFSGIINNP